MLWREEYHFSLDTPFEQYPQEIQDVLIRGTGGQEVKVYYKGQRGEGIYDVAFEGLIRNVERRYRETFSEASKAEYETFMRITPCSLCKGKRLKQVLSGCNGRRSEHFRCDEYVNCGLPDISGWSAFK